MAKIIVEEKTFGVVDIAPSEMPLQELMKENKVVYLQKRRKIQIASRKDIKEYRRRSNKSGRIFLKLLQLAQEVVVSV